MNCTIVLTPTLVAKVGQDPCYEASIGRETETEGNKKRGVFSLEQRMLSTKHESPLYKVRKESVRLHLRCRACRLRSKLAGRGAFPKTGPVGSLHNKETIEMRGEVEGLQTCSGNHVHRWDPTTAASLLCSAWGVLSEKAPPM